MVSVFGRRARGERLTWDRKHEVNNVLLQLMASWHHGRNGENTTRTLATFKLNIFSIIQLIIIPIIYNYNYLLGHRCTLRAVHLDITSWSRIYVAYTALHSTLPDELPRDMRVSILVIYLVISLRRLKSPDYVVHIYIFL